MGKLKLISLKASSLRAPVTGVLSSSETGYCKAAFLKICSGNGFLLDLRRATCVMKEQLCYLFSVVSKVK